MYTIHQAPARNLVPSNWILDSIRDVRDRLLAIPAEDLADARDDLALALSECVGGLSVQPPVPTKVVRGNTRVTDGPDDFETTDGWPDEPSWCDADVWTPTDVLALSLPALSGGSPDAEPSPQDWADYRIWSEAIDRKWRDEQMNAVNEGVELDSSPLSESDIQIAVGSF